MVWPRRPDEHLRGRGPERLGAERVSEDVSSARLEGAAGRAMLRPIRRDAHGPFGPILDRPLDETGGLVVELAACDDDNVALLLEEGLPTRIELVPVADDVEGGIAGERRLDR